MTEEIIWGDDFNTSQTWIYGSLMMTSHISNFLPNSEFFPSKICNHPEFTSFVFLVAGMSLRVLAMFKLLKKNLSVMGISFWFLQTSFVSENNGLSIFFFNYWNLSWTIINTVYLITSQKNCTGYLFVLSQGQRSKISGYIWREGSSPHSMYNK